MARVPVARSPQGREVAAENPSELKESLSQFAEIPQADAPIPPNTQRDDRGRLLPGNTLPVKHGLQSARDLANLDAEVSTFLAASLTDDGGETEVATRRRSLHEYRARLHRRIAQLDAALETRGLIDNRGRLRVAWLQQWAGLVATALSIDRQLGLGRRAKRVPTAAELLRGEQP